MKPNIANQQKITLTSHKNLVFKNHNMKRNRQVRSVCFEMFSKQLFKNLWFPEAGGVRSSHRKESKPEERRTNRKRNRGKGRVARFALGFKVGLAQVEEGMWQKQSVTHASHTRRAWLVNVHVVVNYTRTLRRLHQG